MYPLNVMFLLAATKISKHHSNGQGYVKNKVYPKKIGDTDNFMAQHLLIPSSEDYREQVGAGLAFIFSQGF
ncbi:hypothetical protein TNCT_108151 [Trichonephila clavata]|uniref:Uncharacterized protein n=1 Tax=Trichonephila clavata TaxID=2740835 RepID=A0A8X6G690_TRICU|nr:hypothetical protein TNCT_108151 [Trichonephila clavata]